MFSGHSVLSMAQVKYIGSIMSISRCERCDGKAIVYGIDGSWRCVICDPKEFTWNKKTMRYE